MFVGAFALGARAYKCASALARVCSVLRASLLSVRRKDFGLACICLPPSPLTHPLTYPHPSHPNVSHSLCLPWKRRSEGGRDTRARRSKAGEQRTGAAERRSRTGSRRCRWVSLFLPLPLVSLSVSLSLSFPVLALLRGSRGARPESSGSRMESRPCMWTALFFLLPLSLSLSFSFSLSFLVLPFFEAPEEQGRRAADRRSSEKIKDGVKTLQVG